MEGGRVKSGHGPRRVRFVCSGLTSDQDKTHKTKNLGEWVIRDSDGVAEPAWWFERKDTSTDDRRRPRLAEEGERLSLDVTCTRCPTGLWMGDHWGETATGAPVRVRGYRRVELNSATVTRVVAEALRQHPDHRVVVLDVS